MRCENANRRNLLLLKINILFSVGKKYCVFCMNLFFRRVLLTRSFFSLYIFTIIMLCVGMYLVDARLLVCCVYNFFWMLMECVQIVKEMIMWKMRMIPSIQIFCFFQYYAAICSLYGFKLIGLDWRCIFEKKTRTLLFSCAIIIPSCYITFALCFVSFRSSSC